LKSSLNLSQLQLEITCIPKSYLALHKKGPSSLITSCRDTVKPQTKPCCNRDYCSLDRTRIDWSLILYSEGVQLKMFQVCSSWLHKCFTHCMVSDRKCQCLDAGFAQKSHSYRLEDAATTMRAAKSVSTGVTSFGSALETK